MKFPLKYFHSEVKKRKKKNAGNVLENEKIFTVPSVYKFSKSLKLK